MSPFTTRVYSIAGGLCFIASLSYFIYVYFVRFGIADTNSGQVLSSLTTNIVLFTAFASHHSLLARERVKDWIIRYIPAELERSTYIWFASVLFTLMCAWWRPMSGTLYAAVGVARIFGFIVQCMGIVVSLWSVSMLDPLKLAGLRPTTTPNTLSTTDTGELCVQGLYQWVRHPIYFGWILFVFGTPDMTLERFSFAAISTTYIVLALPWEERSMVHTFGARYESYRNEVKWRIIPGIY